MLGKLLKHEWKVVWKVPTLLIGILMITAVTAGLTFSLPIWDSDWVGLPLSGVMLILTFYFAMIGVGIGITIYFAVRYYKSMFTDEGYLTHTLPVTSHQLLLSKIITISAWNLICSVAVIVSIGIFGCITLFSLLPKDSRFAMELVDEFTEVIKALPELWSNPYMRGINGFCASVLCLAVSGTLSGTMMLIASVNLGQMLRKHRILGAVGAYFAIQMVFSFFTTLFTLPMTIMRMDTAFDSSFDRFPFLVFTSTYFINSALYVAAAVGLYFLSEYLIRRQLELE